MPIATGIAIYVLIWWITLFAVLPWGIRSQAESGDVTLGTDPGAPSRHVMWRKILWTTAVASVIFAAFYFAYSRGWFSIDIPLGMPGERR
jgi:predicted secreted protein